ncbi:MAG: relaxase/mobilization nuclease domain-containing protein [Cyclobacteriaceae bacterium]
MIGQVTIGKSFGGVVRYVMEKDQAEVLDQSGVRADDPVHVIQDFNSIRTQKFGIKNAVWHTSISFAYDDKLTIENMIAIGKDYLEEIGLKDHQYLMVRHQDTQHEHIHIISNRVGYNGELVSDQWCKNRTASICDKLEEKYGLTIARDQRKQHGKLNDKIPVRKATRNKIKIAISQALEKGIKDYDELKFYLKEQGIDMNFQLQSTGRINGVVFKYKDLSFKGSSIDKSFSFKRLAKRLGQNNHRDKDQDHDKRRKD